MEDAHGACNAFDIYLAGIGIDCNTMDFDTHVFTSFFECCMGRRRYYPARQSAFVYIIISSSHISGSVIPFTDLAQSR
jgi:hypothetical protein